MGTLSVTIGPITSSLNFDNTKGSALIKNCLYAYLTTEEVDEMTNQQMVDAFTQLLGRHARDSALGYIRRKEEAAARLAAAAAEAENNWT